MKAACTGFITGLLLLAVSATTQAQNPFVRNIYTADPSAHVWADGRLYVYPSHDIEPPQGCDLMDKYHVFSTDDMVNWVDHGEILGAADVAWGRDEGGFMWAPDCAYKDGTYYFYFPHPSGNGDEWNSTWKIGVATSSEPAANFVVQGYIEGLESMIDPCVFVDDDGQAYLYYGGGGRCEAGKLKDNMVAIDGQMQQMQGLVDFHEAAWVHKYNGMYYLSYSDNNSSGGNQLRYAVSDKPLGPWTYKGVYVKPTGSPTNHGSIVEYQGQWYAFYHNSVLSGHPWLRSICVDPLFYNDDGTIQMVTQTREHGTPHREQPFSIPGIIEAEDYDRGGQGKAYSDADPLNNGNAYRDDAVDVEMNSPGNYNVGWTEGGEWLEYTVNVAENSAYVLKTIAASPNSNSRIRFKIDGHDITGSVTIPNTGGWQRYDTISTTGISLDAGIHILQLFEETGGFNIDKVVFEKEVITSVSATRERNPIRIYPNPASTEVTVQFSEEDPFVCRLAIFDMTGQMVAVFDNVKKESGILLDVGRLDPGCYVLRMYTAHAVHTRKLLINGN